MVTPDPCSGMGFPCSPQVDVAWRLEAPFAISPPAASLAPGETLSFSVAFTPPEACSYHATGACQLESGAAAICKVGGWLVGWLMGL